MQMILEDKYLWSIVCSEKVEPDGEGSTKASIQKFRKRARKAFATICLSLGDNQLSLVLKATLKKLDLILKILTLWFKIYHNT